MTTPGCLNQHRSPQTWSRTISGSSWGGLVRFGSRASGVTLPSSDLDIVCELPAYAYELRTSRKLLLEQARTESAAAPATAPAAGADTLAPADEPHAMQPETFGSAAEDDGAPTESDGRLTCVPKTQQRLPCWWDEQTELPEVGDTVASTSITRSTTCRYDVFLTCPRLRPFLGDFFVLAKEVGQRRREACVKASTELAPVRVAHTPLTPAPVEHRATHKLSPTKRVALQAGIDGLHDDQLDQVRALIWQFSDLDPLLVDLGEAPAPLQRELFVLVERMSGVRQDHASGCGLGAGRAAHWGGEQRR